MVRLGKGEWGLICLHVSETPGRDKYHRLLCGARMSYLYSKSRRDTSSCRKRFKWLSAEVFEKSIDGLRGSWVREERALELPAAEVAQHLVFRRGLDPLGDRVNLQGVRHLQ